MSETDIPDMSPNSVKASTLDLALLSLCLGIAFISPVLRKDNALPRIELIGLPRASAMSSTNAPLETKPKKVVSSSGE